MSTFRSRMVASPSIPLSTLGVAELFVLSSFRLWMLSHCYPERPWPDWHAGFAQAEVPSEGIHGFNSYCWALVESAREPLRVHSLHCPFMHEHETWPLQIVSLLQLDRSEAVTAILAQRCTQSAVRLAIDPARTFAHALLSRRLQLSVPCPYRTGPTPPAEHYQSRIWVAGSARTH